MTRFQSDLVWLAGLLALTFALFGDLLFAGGTRVISHPGADLVLQYYSWRDFGFHELAKGHLALWNPYIFGGAPFFGGMQSALLYPPNWLFLLLPIAKAINWTVALNIFGLGAFTFCWMRVRGLAAPASFFAGALVMLGGSHFLHVFGGHLPQMATMTWSPLIFCAIDGFFSTRKVGWSLLGIFAVAMQMLAGFPQYVFYVGIVAGLYSALRLIGQWSWRLAIGLLAMYLGGFLLTAVQLLPAVTATSETVRGIRVPFEFASQCGFPPENLLTLVAPNLFGTTAGYWGRCYLWETSLFLSMTGLVLAVYAAIYLDRKTKWIPLVVIFVALVLALGAYTPLFRILYNYAPGFDRLRANAKFGFPASLFLVLLATTGLDRLFKQRVDSKFAIGIFGFAVILLSSSWWATNTSSWNQILHWMQNSHETYLRPQLYDDYDFLQTAQRTTATSLLIAGATTTLIGLLFTLTKRSTAAVYALIVVGLGEMILFAATNRPTFDSAIIVNADEKSFVAAHPGDYRILSQLNPNSAMSLRIPDIWGYDPNVVRRYAEFITWTQGGDPNDATLYVKFARFDPLYAMLRLRYVFGQRDGEFQSAEAPVAPMPHVQLISNHRVVAGRDAIFDAMRSPEFDPTREVILETEPDPRPMSNDKAGTAKITNESTDALTIEADVDHPSVLLITDVFTPAWRAIALPGSVRSKYDLLPANYVLRAVPLVAGHHHLRVEYAPPGFEIGKWISVISAVLFLAALFRSRMRTAE
jgi:hypothetical protein